MFRVLEFGLVDFNSAGQPLAPQFWRLLVPMIGSVTSFQPSPSVSQGTPTAIEPAKVRSGVTRRLSAPRWPLFVRVSGYSPDEAPAST